MPSKRRSGFRPPELRGTLGTLLRTTTGVVRDALERGAREGRARLDDVRTSRRRHDALAELGELVLDLIRRGEIDLAELPEARDVVRLLDEFDAESDDDDRDEPAPDVRRFGTRKRFDDRPPTRPPPVASRSSSSPSSSSLSSSSSSPSSSSSSSRAMPSSRPPLSASRATPSHRQDEEDDEAHDEHDHHAGRDERTDRESRTARDARTDRDARDDHAAHATDRDLHDRSRRAAAIDADSPDRSPRRSRAGSDAPPRRLDPSSDGTVSSGLGDRAMRPTVPALPKHTESPSTRAPTKPIKGLWRPQIDDAPAFPDPDRPDRPRNPLPRDPTRKGGITFDDDDDLADYMHPDDVPPKPPAKDPGDADP